MNQLTMEEIKFLNEKAKNIRIDILKSITKANSGHTGGSLSIADLLTLLFFHEMNIRQIPRWKIETVWSYPKDMVLRHCMLP